MIRGWDSISNSPGFDLAANFSATESDIYDRLAFFGIESEDIPDVVHLKACVVNKVLPGPSSGTRALVVPEVLTVRIGVTHYYNLRSFFSSSAN